MLSQRQLKTWKSGKISISISPPMCGDAQRKFTKVRSLLDWLDCGWLWTSREICVWMSICPCSHALFLRRATKCFQIQNFRGVRLLIDRLLCMFTQEPAAHRSCLSESAHSPSSHSAHWVMSIQRLLCLWQWRVCHSLLYAVSLVSVLSKQDSLKVRCYLNDLTRYLYTRAICTQELSYRKCTLTHLHTLHAESILCSRYCVSDSDWCVTVCVWRWLSVHSFGDCSSVHWVILTQSLLCQWQWRVCHSLLRSASCEHSMRRKTQRQSPHSDFY